MMKKYNDKLTIGAESKNKLKLNFMQKIYVACGLLYGGFWLKKDYLFDFMDLKNSTFYILSAFMAFFSIAVIHFNRKNERNTAEKTCCNMIALFAFGVFVVRLLRIISCSFPD